jgi:hypothetical protein
MKRPAAPAVLLLLLLLCSGTALAQSDDDDIDNPPPASQQPAKQQPKNQQSGVPGALDEARKSVRGRCAAEVRARTPRLTADDARNAWFVCMTKTSYDCAVAAEEQKIVRAKRLEFIDACLRGGEKQ